MVNLIYVLNVYDLLVILEKLIVNLLSLLLIVKV